MQDYLQRVPHVKRLSGGSARPLPEATTELSVSVITITYNSIATLERTIDSVRDQSYKFIEYLVVDGGSSDGTLDILRSRDADITHWISEPDNGISDAFNKGVAMAKGSYVAILNSDDWLDPDNLRLAVDAMRDESIDFVFGDLLLHSADGTPRHFFTGEANYAARIAHYMPFLNHPTVVCRRSAFERIGLFDTDLRTAMDYDWFLRLHNAGGKGRYVKGLLTNMTLEGKSDNDFLSGLREVREISIRRGYPAWLAWPRYGVRVIHSKSRRFLQKYLPTHVVDALRKRINVNYKSSAGRPI